MARCFIALEIPDNVKKQIYELQKQVCAIGLIEGKMTEIQNLHLTLKFLGEISEKDVEIIKRILEKIKFSKFQVELSELGVFNKDFIRIIWLSLSGKALFDLQEKIDSALSDFFKKEERFMTHITIARPKFVHNKKEFIQKLNELKFERTKFLVDCFILKESILKKSGPIYKDIKKFELL